MKVTRTLKAISAIVASYFLGSFLLGCNEIGLDGLFTRNIGGIYIGKANLILSQRRITNGVEQKIILLDTIFPDIITVKTDSKSDKKYLIHRRSAEQYNFYYDFSDPDQAICLNDQFEWGGTFDYDRYWVWHLKFDPGKNSLSALLSQDDIFNLYETDSMGNEVAIFNKEEYTITAFK